MLTTIVVLLRSIGLICRGHHAVALENLALRQQLAALKRTRTRPHLRPTDRLFWVLLANAWREWRTALMVVQPETVLRWHRQFVAAGRTVRHGSARAARVPMRPFAHSCTRWLVRIRCGERHESMASWVSWASRSRSEPCRDCSLDEVVRPPRGGERSWTTTPQPWSRWTSSRSQPSRDASCSSSCCSATNADASSTSRSRTIRRRVDGAADH